MLSFSEFVHQRLRVLNWSEGDLAHAMGYGGTGYLYNVLNGKRPPPLKRVEDWVRALRLDDADAQTLRILAENAHVPPLTRARIEKLQRRIEALEAQQVEKDRRIAELDQLLRELTQCQDKDRDGNLRR